MKQWHLLEAERLVESPWLSLERNSYKINEEQVVTDYYVVRRKPFVLVVANHKENILLVTQYRPATEKFYLSVPAGYVEEGEEIIDAAERELLEETGATGENFKLIGQLDPLPGYISSQASIVVCDCLTPPDIERSDGEIILVDSFPWEEIMKMILSGAINEMQTVSALLFAKLWLNS